MIKKYFIKLANLLFFITIHEARAELFLYHDEITDLYGFKDAHYHIVMVPQFDFVMRSYGGKFFSEEDKENQFLAAVVKKGELWRMTSEGKLKFRTVFFDNGPDYYEEGLARFMEGDKVGFHDPEGNIIIEPSYSFATPFRNGYAYVSNGCHTVYPAPPTYAPLSTRFYQYPREEMYRSFKGGKWGIIDKKNTLVVPMIYDSIEELIDYGVNSD